MNKKNIPNMVLIFLVIILASALVYVAFLKKPVSTYQKQETNTPNTQQSKITIPKEYVKKTQDSANKATFVFTVPIKNQDIVATNIRYCVVSASAGAQADGKESECKETTSVNSFSLEYDEITKTLMITDPTPGEWGVDSGPFRIGCAACFSTIEFSGLHTSDGQLLPKAIVTVY